MSTIRRTRGVWSTPRPLGPGGEKLCYNCRGPLPKGRRYNCSAECSEEWRAKTSPSYMRFLLRRRDQGICALCSVDTLALRKAYRELPDQQTREAFRTEHGIPAGRAWADWWDADHILAVIEGGGECDLANLRTLCIPCHRKATRELHARIKRRRIEARPLPLFDELEEECSTLPPAIA